MLRNDEPSDHGSRPTLPHPVVDTPGLDKLEGSLNDLSKAAATQSLTYLLLWLYLIFTVTAVTDYDLLVEKPIKLPIFDLEVGLLKFFIGAPALFWLVQLYMVRKVSVIADAVRHYLTVAEREAAKHAASPGAVLEALRHRVDGFVVTRLLARFDTVRCGDACGPATPPLPQALTVLAAAVTLVLAPVLLYGAFQIRFLAYQHEWITWWHRVSLFAGLALSAAAAREAGLTWAGTARAMRDLGTGLFGGLLRRHAERRRPEGERWPDRLSRRLAANAVPAVVAASLLVATTPGEFLSDGVTVEGRPLGDLLAEGTVPRSLSPRAPNARLAIARTDSDADNISKAGLPRLELSHRDFSRRSLRKAKLADMNLSGSILTGAQLQGADLQGTQLNGSNLLYASLKGANLTDTQFNGADLTRAQLQEAKLERTQFQRAKLNRTEFQDCYLEMIQLEGAELAEAQLQNSYIVKSKLNGARLPRAQLQGAHLFETYLQGADLTYASLQGADINNAQLQGANLTGTQLQGAKIVDTHLQGAALIRSLLHGSIIAHTHLQGADLADSQLQGAFLYKNMVWKTRFGGAVIDNIFILEENQGLVIDESSSYASMIEALFQKYPPLSQDYLVARRLQYLAETEHNQREMEYILRVRRIITEASLISTTAIRTNLLVKLACKDKENKYFLIKLLFYAKSISYDNKIRSYLSIPLLNKAISNPKICPSSNEIHPSILRNIQEIARQLENSEITSK